ncbi:MAG: NAD(P)H-binding protein [Bacteroidales bacterium]|nr:NAD(P)H-binding protein [Bacteroidales bacterium]
MTNNLKIAIIGGTGKAGGYVVKQLLSDGFIIKILVRNSKSSSFKNENIEIIKGDVKNYNDVLTLFEGCSAVISTLGQDFNAKPMFNLATENIIRAMSVLKIKRYIMIAGIAINHQNDAKNFKIKLTSNIMKFLFSGTINDKQKAFNLLSKSNLDWTVIRVPMIKLNNASEKISTNLTDCKGTKINATDLAKFIVNQINSNNYINKAPFVFN